MNKFFHPISIVISHSKKEEIILYIDKTDAETLIHCLLDECFIDFLTFDYEYEGSLEQRFEMWKKEWAPIISSITDILLQIKNYIC